LSKMPGPRIGRAPWKTSSRSRQAEPIIDLLRNPVREDDRDLAILNWMIVGIYGVLTFAGSRARGCRCVSRSRSGTVSHRTTAECGSRAAVRPGIGRAPARADLLSSGPCRPPLCVATICNQSAGRMTDLSRLAELPFFGGRMRDRSGEASPRLQPPRRHPQMQVAIFTKMSPAH
jgi:hypothetical protein